MLRHGKGSYRRAPSRSCGRTRRMVGLVRLARLAGTPSRPAHLRLGRRAGVRGRSCSRPWSRGTERYAVDHVGRLRQGRPVRRTSGAADPEPGHVDPLPGDGRLRGRAVEGRSRDVLCLDRIPRRRRPGDVDAAEIGRVRGRRGRAHALVARVFLARAGRGDRPRVRGSAAWPGRRARAVAIGAGAGAVFAAIVTMTSLAGSLWLVPASGNETTPSFGPDPGGRRCWRSSGACSAGVVGVAGRPAHRRRADVIDRARPR